MPIERITAEEFALVTLGRKGRRTAETKALIELPIGETMKMPCRWAHNRRQCSGAATLHNVARHCGFSVSSHCENGILYVLKKEHKEGVA